MRHRVKKHLHFRNKTTSHRNAVIRNLLTAFCVHKHVKTTRKRAVVLSGVIDRMIRSVHKKKSLNAIRYVMKHVYTKEASKEFLDVICPKYTKRISGITRITPIELRKGDGAKHVLIDLV